MFALVFWVCLIGYAVLLIHPASGPRARHQTRVAVLQGWTFAAPLTLPIQRFYDEQAGQLQERQKLRALYGAEFRDQFASFRSFEAFYRWLESNQHIDPTKPLAPHFAASLDLCDDAESLLGLSRDYSQNDLKARYHGLMKQVHPDVAGPNDIARRITEARNLLSARKGWK